MFIKRNFLWAFGGNWLNFKIVNPFNLNFY